MSDTKISAARLAWIFVASSLASCTTTPPTGAAGDPIHLTDSHPKDFPSVSAKSLNGLASYKFLDKDHQAQWLSCKSENATATALIMHRDEAGFDEAKFCTGWIAQAFLVAGLDVIAVNRPGFVKSTGTADFSGPQSIAAIAAGTKEAIAKIAAKPSIGAYGFSSGAIAAGMYAKQNAGLKWLILGDGIYDLEAVIKATASDYIKRETKAVMRTEGEMAVERRSIAYDPSGLPKRIALFHGRKDDSVPIAQAQAFRDGLAASGEYQVSLDALDGVGHEMDWVHHRQILDAMIRAVAR